MEQLKFVNQNAGSIADCNCDLMRAPVALIIFNRPEVTARVAEAIAKARPPQVFVVADGPRPDRPTDTEKCPLLALSSITLTGPVKW